MAKREAKMEKMGMEWSEGDWKSHAKMMGWFWVIGGILFLAVGLGYLKQYNIGWEAIVGLGLLVMGLKKLSWSMM